jgi:hypothetical protein
MRRKNRLQVLCQSVGGEPLPLLVQSDGKAVMIRYLRDSPSGRADSSKRRGSATDRQRGSGRKTALAPAEEEGTTGIRESGPILTKQDRWISGIFPLRTGISKASLPEGSRPGNVAQVAVPFGASESRESRKGTAGSNRRRLLYLRHSYTRRPRQSSGSFSSQRRPIRGSHDE